jgi:hypothetical protein
VFTRLEDAGPRGNTQMTLEKNDLEIPAALERGCASGTFADCRRRFPP